MPKIIIHHPDGTSAKYGLNGPSFTIGRAAGNDIILPAGAASSHHAVLKMNESGDFTVTDLESTNKTKVNGRAIQTSPLRDGDSLLFGDIAADYQSEIPRTAPYLEDQPTQIYEQSPAASSSASSTAPGVARAAPVVVVPQMIARPASTTARRSSRSPEDGCFTMVVFAFVLPFAFFIGLVIRHHQEKGEWFWNYARVVFFG
jgi:pSer/pThr/pTyr-binding forkhead associated (FHA) protein